jgi:hypothetical protein
MTREQYALPIVEKRAGVVRAGDEWDAELACRAAR